MPATRKTPSYQTPLTIFETMVTRLQKETRDPRCPTMQQAKAAPTRRRLRKSPK